MSAPADDAQREILPRWRDLQSTTRVRELAPRQSEEPQIHLEADFLAQKIADWQREQSVPFAAEVVGAALVLQRPTEGTQAAEFILANRHHATPASLELARRITTTDAHPGVPTALNAAALHDRIRTLKAAVRFAPRNAFAWAELARLYTNVGVSTKAMHCMDVALDLAPNNRYVLRSAARLHTHTHNNQRAHDILMSAAVTPGDPWLLAAEISTAALAGKSSKLIKTATKLLAARHFGPFDTAELAGALATQDAKAGFLRHARKLFRVSLQAPNENVLAQARWAATQKFIDLDPALLTSVPAAFEAHAWQAFYAGHWEAALRAGKRWLRDQPFAASPAIHASYIAATSLQNHDQALRIVDQGLLANPHHPSLLNNKAFSLAQVGRLREADDALKRARARTPDGPTNTILLATEGLIAYRNGDPQRGRTLYQTAIENARKAGQQSLARKAALFFALEELRVASTDAQALAENVLRDSAQETTSDVQLLRYRIAQALTY